MNHIYPTLLHRQACPSHHQIVIWICFWFCICQRQQKWKQILRRKCCLLLHRCQSSSQRCGSCVVWSKTSGLQRGTSRPGLWKCGLQHASTLAWASHNREGLQLLLARELCLAAEYCREVGTLWRTKCSCGQIYRFLLTRKALALKEYFPWHQRMVPGSSEQHILLALKLLVVILFRRYIWKAHGRVQWSYILW